MFEFIDSLQIFASLATGAAAAFAFGDSMGALSAKRHFRTKVLLALEKDPELRVWRQRVDTANLSAVDMAELHKILDRIADSLPEKEQVSVKKSLNQPSKAGERRYITEMLSLA